MYLIKNAQTYAPEYIGIKDILICGGVVEKIADSIKIDTNANVEVIDAAGLIAVPGFVDNHVHITGGGGEGGFATRTPEITLTQITTAGITTLIGLLGTDGIARDLGGLVAKVNALKLEGVSAYAMTGAYQVPAPNLTGSTKSDIMFVDPIIGSGEIAISDHRSSQPSFQEIIRIISETRVAGMLSGKAGVTILHLGDGKAGLKYLNRMREETELPLSCVLPTHISRNNALLDEGIDYAKSGGYIDFTACPEDTSVLDERELPAWDAIRVALNAGVSIDHITMSSDGQGSMPLFDRDKNYLGIGVGTVDALHYSFVRMVKSGMPIETALRPITSSPAALFKLKQKGHIAEGMDADITLLSKSGLEVDTVLAKGRLMVHEGKPIVKGTFEH